MAEKASRGPRSADRAASATQQVTKFAVSCCRALLWTYDLPTVVVASFWPFTNESGMLGGMTAHANDTAPNPAARFDDLHLDHDDDRAEWHRRLRELATARARLERLGIVDAEGKVVSADLPPDMLPDSDTTLETG